MPFNNLYLSDCMDLHTDIGAIVHLNLKEPLYHGVQLNANKRNLIYGKQTIKKECLVQIRFSDHWVSLTIFDIFTASAIYKGSRSK